MEDWRARISIDPAVCFGKPCVRGTRIWVSLILDLLAGGMSVGEILQEYPHLTDEVSRMKFKLDENFGDTNRENPAGRRL